MTTLMRNVQLVFMGFLSAVSSGQPRFEPIDDPYTGQPFAISDDGRVVPNFGGSPESQSCAPSGQAHRWIEGIGGQYLYGVCSWYGSSALDVTGDGVMILYELWSGSGPQYACGLWTEAGGADELPNPGAYTGVQARALSPDGRWAAIDWYVPGNDVPYLWSVEERRWHLLVPDTDWRGTVSAVANGGVAAATSFETRGARTMEYIRWTPEGGATPMPLPQGTTPWLTQQFSISSDGRIIFGTVDRSGTLLGTFWLNEGQDFVVVPGVTNIGRTRISDDGRIVLCSNIDGTARGIWTARRGIRPLAEILADAGVDVTGWALDGLADITPDGRIILGWGTNPEGEFHPFRIIGRLYCAPDCNDDGKLNVNDFICFQAKWKAHDFYADYKLDGKWDINDFIAFQADWRKGCE